MSAFWAVAAAREAAAAGQPAAPAPAPPPEDPSDCIVVLTFQSGRRDLSFASLLTLADARAEAEAWRRRKPDGMSPGPVRASVHRIGKPLP